MPGSTAPADPDPQPSRFYSEADDRLILATGIAGGSWEDLATRLGPHRTPHSLRRRFLFLEGPAARAIRLGTPEIVKPGARRRPCLGCGRSFNSEGRHNRMCDPCRADAW